MKRFACSTLIVFAWLGITGLGRGQSASPKIGVMTFNVENLFDTKHDAGKNDETFLPKAKKGNAKHQAKCQKISVPKWRDECLNLDWSDAVLEQKIERLAQVISSANHQKGADVIFLQEIENLAVLTQLNRDGLAKLGYKPVLIEGRDVRGIDVAMLTRLPVLKARLRTIPFQGIGKGVDDTRGILNLRLRGPDGLKLSFFVVHLPAPFHPHQWREQALRYLTKLARKESAQGYVVAAAGDFNISSSEERDVGILKPFEKEWLISHHVGCKSCLGSTYYAKDKSWSFLDQVWAFKENESKGWQMDPDSVALVKPLAEQIDNNTQGPRSLEVLLDGKTSAGVSDHFPMYVEFKPVKKQTKPSHR